MPDPGSPDQGPKPFKPDPKKGWYTPPSGPPRKLDEGDNTPHQDQTPATDQETLFRAAAIKCAQMEEELADLTNNFTLGEHKIEVKGASIKLRRYDWGSIVTIRSESFRGVGARGKTKDALLMFTTNQDKDSIQAQSIDIKTKHELSVNGVHADQPTLDRFSELKGNAFGIDLDTSTSFFLMKTEITVRLSLFQII